MTGRRKVDPHVGFVPASKGNGQTARTPLALAVSLTLSTLPQVSAGQGIGVGDPAARSTLPTPAAGQSSAVFEPAVRAEVLWSDNAAYQPRGFEEKDTIFTLGGDVTFRRFGPRLGFSGSIGFEAIEYLNNTQRDRVLPRADVRANLEAIEDFFFIDANVFVTQTPINAFDVRTGPSSTFNKVTTSEVDLIPALRGRLGENVTYQARSANTWTDSAQATNQIADGYFGDHSIVLDRAPTPLGGFASVSSSTTKYDDQLNPALREDIARVGLNYVVTPQLSIGVRGGYEDVEGVVRNTTGSIYGGQFEWRPTDRTSATGFFEERYFGNSWNARFSHRRPRAALEVTTARDVSTFAETLLSLPRASSVAALIDAALTTRIPDPTQRAQAVRNLLDATGLSGALNGPMNIYSERVLITTRTAGTLTLLGVRNSIGATLYYQQNRDLVSQVASDVVPDLSSTNNNRQTGVALTFSHQLAATMSVGASGDWSRMRGLDANSDEQSTQQSATLAFNQQLAPRTFLNAGYRYINFESNVNADSRENAVFVAVTHRF